MGGDLLLFLDFDGVLHPGVRPFPEPDCIAALTEAVSGLELDMVVSSSWREQFTLDELRGFLGPILGPRLIAVTPVIDDPFLHHVRYHEVRQYLDGLQTIPPWIAIDDTRGFYPADAPVYWTDPNMGFKEHDIDPFRSLYWSIREAGRERVNQPAPSEHYGRPVMIGPSAHPLISK